LEVAKTIPVKADLGGVGSGKRGGKKARSSKKKQHARLKKMGYHQASIENDDPTRSTKGGLDSKTGTHPHRHWQKDMGEDRFGEGGGVPKTERRKKVPQWHKSKKTGTTWLASVTLRSPIV